MSSGNRWHSEKWVASFWTNLHWIQTDMRTRTLFMRCTFMIDWMNTSFLAEKIDEIITLQWHVNHWSTKPPAMCSLNGRWINSSNAAASCSFGILLPAEWNTQGFKYRIQALTVLWNYLDSFNITWTNSVNQGSHDLLMLHPFSWGHLWHTCWWLSESCFLLNRLNQAFHWPPLSEILSFLVTS